MSFSQEQRVGRVARTISGSGFPHEYQGRFSGDLPFVKVSDLQRSENLNGIQGSANYVSFKDMRTLGARVVPAGSIVFPKIGAALLGNARRLTLTECLLDNNLMAIVPREGDPRYWKYALSIVDLGKLSGSGPLPYVSDSQVRDIRLPFPPSSEQQRVADFLDAETNRIDSLVGLRKSQLESISTRMRSYLSHVSEALQGRHGTVRVRHVLQKIEQGWSPQCEDRPARKGEWGVVKAGCVNGGIFDANQHKALPAETHPEVRYRLRPGDLLMSRASGSVDLIGSLGVLPEDLPPQLLLCDKIYRLRMDRTRMMPTFVAFMLSSHQARELIKLGISGADGMANNLPTATVTNLPLPNVPLTDQARAVDDLIDRRRSIEAARQALADQLALLTERRQALIAAVVTGQIDVTTASDRSLSGVASL